jgi:hypothetical protein
MKQQLLHAMDKMLYLGFNVHKDSIVIAYAQSGGGDPILYAD